MRRFENNISHQCKAVDVKEIVKLAQITDPFGNLRYKVSMTSYDVINDNRYELRYQIQVINYFGVVEPLVIVDRPEDDELPISDYNYALSIYNEYVRTYSNLVNAECRDHQDIEVYKENIGYKQTVPECCSTCKWCRRRKTPHEFIYGVSEKLECTNPLNCKQFETDIVREYDPTRDRYDASYGHIVYPDDYSHNVIYPDVDPFGKCDHYIVVAYPNTIAPGMNVTDFIDMRLGTRMDSRFENITRTVISTELSSDLSVPVVQAITMVLSGPEASVALSAPVVNLVTNSQQIQANTVNVIGNALSTNVLSAQMTTAVSSVISDPALSGALEEPVAAAMTTPTVKAQTVNVIGNALSSNELSSQMVPAVATVIPEEQVSSVVVTTAASGITIDQIAGNNGIHQFNDKNGNGWQDEGEEDLSELQTVVLGDLGA